MTQEEGQDLGNKEQLDEDQWSTSSGGIAVAIYHLSVQKNLFYKAKKLKTTLSPDTNFV